MTAVESTHDRDRILTDSGLAAVVACWPVSATVSGSQPGWPVRHGPPEQREDNAWLSHADSVKLDEQFLGGASAESIFDHLVDLLLVLHPRPPFMDGRG